MPERPISAHSDHAPHLLAEEPPSRAVAVEETTTRAQIDAAYDAAHRRLMEQMPPRSFASEWALLDEAVRLTASDH